jgi:hypothetical protein
MGSVLLILENCIEKNFHVLRTYESGRYAFNLRMTVQFCVSRN